MDQPRVLFRNGHPEPSYSPPPLLESPPPRQLTSVDRKLRWGCTILAALAMVGAGWLLDSFAGAGLIFVAMWLIAFVVWLTPYEPPTEDDMEAE